MAEREADAEGGGRRGYGLTVHGGIWCFIKPGHPSLTTFQNKSLLGEAGALTINIIHNASLVFLLLVEWVLGIRGTAFHKEEFLLGRIIRAGAAAAAVAASRHWKEKQLAAVIYWRGGGLTALSAGGVNNRRVWWMVGSRSVSGSGLLPCLSSHSGGEFPQQLPGPFSY